MAETKTKKWEKSVCAVGISEWISVAKADAEGRKQGKKDKLESDWGGPWTLYHPEQFLFILRWTGSLTVRAGTWLLCKPRLGG